MTETTHTTDTITVTANGYRAMFDLDTRVVEIFGDSIPAGQGPTQRSTRQHLGTGRWDGDMIADCPAALDDEIYEALDAALHDALPL